MSVIKTKRKENSILTLIMLVVSCLVCSIYSLELSAQSGLGWNGGIGLFCMNAIPMLLAVLFLWFGSGISWLSFLVVGAFVCVLTGANYFKVVFRDDPVVWSDLHRLKECFQMAGTYHVALTPMMYGGIALVIAITILLFIFGKGHPGIGVRFVGITLSMILGVVSFYEIYPSNDIYVEFAGEHAASVTDSYKSCGMLYPFLHSAGEYMSSNKGYDMNKGKSILAQYKDSDIPRDKKVSVIGIQLEAFADFTPYGIDGLSDSVYAGYETLKNQSYSGNLITDIFAGGTTESEWAVLTGGNVHDDFANNTDSIAWYFRNQGYVVNGSHPSHEWFYDRVNVNNHLGFEEYLFMENYYNKYTDDDVCYDNIYFPDLEERLEDYFSNYRKPLFSFNVTYQGHGPYNSEMTYWGESFCTGNYSDESIKIMNNYFYCIQDTSEHLVHLTELLNQQDKPIVLFLYGDHKPWFGNECSVYNELGINLDTQTEEGFRNYYTTWYMIWANDTAKAVLERDFVGDGPDLSPCFLMNEVFKLCGWEGPAYMQAQRSAAEYLPVLHTTGWYLENGALTTELSPAGQAVQKDFASVSAYDRTFGMENNQE